MYIKSISLIFLIILPFYSGAGQSIPHSPFSYRLFHPHVLNPAITGSNDFASINIYATLPKDSPAQLIRGDGRILKKGPAYFLGKPVKEFSNVGVGGYLFNDLHAGSGKIGGAASMAYHIPFNRKATSFLSLGASYKRIHSIIKNNTENGSPSQTSMGQLYNNLDLGIYFYTPRFYAGFSGGDLLESLTSTYKLIEFGLPVNPRYFMHTGYKILISRNHNIVLEPSVYVSTSGFTTQELSDNLQPVLKLYLMDFCVGSSFRDLNKLSFFFQYRYPRFFIGAYFDYPVKTAYYVREPLIEINLGFNLSREKSGGIKHSRW